MLIWCCLCFGLKEDNVMNRGFYLGDSQSEDMDEDDSDSMQPGFLTRNPDDFDVAVEFEIAADLVGSVVRSANDAVNGCSSAGGLQILSINSDTDMSFGIREEPPSSAGSSSSAAALVRGECDWDHLNNKRPKVNRFPMQNKDSAATDVEDCNLNIADHRLDNCSSRETFLLSPMFGGSRDGYINAASGSSDAVHESDDPEFEDFITRMDLTDDLLHMVFSFLEHVDLFRAAMVCRQWRSASAHEDFWRFLNFENPNISLEQFEGICQRYPNATGLNICPAVHSLAMVAVTSLRNLDSLTLGKGQLGEAFFQALPECPSLRNLIISESSLGNGIQEIPIYHDRLKHLQIVKCRVLRISVRCPQLEMLSLKRSNMAHAALNCPLLIDLDIASCHKLSDAAIRSAVISCPLLETLDMSNCSCVTDETLRELEPHCANLHILNASYCPNISLESVRLPTLTVLKLHSCEGITSASMASIAHSHMLEVLELDNCNLLASVTLDLLRLQSIRLVHCRKFVDLNLRSIMLTSITVSNCPNLQRINLTSNLLQKLVLQKQESLTTLALQCQSLQEVDLTDCESLTNSICNVFSDGGGCPMLKSLILDNCEGLTAVVFSSSSLATLSLTGCRAVTSLKLECAHLEKVSLDGCDHLEKASFCPVGLKSLNLGICPKLSLLRIEAPSMLLLELKGCGVLSEASINCPILNSLDASFCSQLKDDCLSATTASCPIIENLVLMSCPSIGPDGLSSLGLILSLTSLDLSYTFLVSLQPVFESCLKLKVLKLQACKYLTDSSLEPLYKGGALPNLCELDLSYGTLCQTAIDELLAFCTHLTHLSLNGCVNMHDLNWGFSSSHTFDSLQDDSLGSNSSNALSIQDDSLGSNSSNALSIQDDSHLSNMQPIRLLQNLNCVGCPNIKKVVIPPAARCFHLSSLNLSLSANLKEVDLDCLNLVSLNLSNCCSLEVLKLECPKLASLFLQSCNIDEEMVAAAISGCTIFETLDIRFCPKIHSMSMVGLRAACPSLKRVYSSITSS